MKAYEGKHLVAKCSPLSNFLGSPLNMAFLSHPLLQTCFYILSSWNQRKLPSYNIFQSLSNLLLAEATKALATSTIPFIFIFPPAHLISPYLAWFYIHLGSITFNTFWYETLHPRCASSLLARSWCATGAYTASSEYRLYCTTTSSSVSRRSEHAQLLSCSNAQQAAGGLWLDEWLSHILGKAC